MTTNCKNLAKLFEEARLGPLTLRNRIVMPAMATLFGNEGGTVSSALLAYYSRRAEGGAGLIIVENTAIHPQGVNYRGTLEIHSDRFEDGLEGLAAGIKGHGAAAAIQLFHPGRQVHPKYAGNDPVAPSPISCPVLGGKPKALAVEEIRDLVRRFADGAARAKAVGFDAVEIHGAHGYLVGQFLSPFSNRRDDAYGGDVQRRARFAVEIVTAIRERVGESFPVIFRLSADEKVAGGLTPEQADELVPHLEQAGVAAFHVSAGCYASMEWVVQPYLQPRGCLTGLALGVRRITDLPVLAVGRINEPKLGNSIVADGHANFVSMGRALMADPDLPAKAREGRFEEIRPCIACNVCIEAVGTQRTRCAVNPEMGREAEPRSAVAGARRVVVVGGGPAGMEAALQADSAGHEVTLVEAGETLGGQLVSAGVPDSKIEMRRLLEHFRCVVERSGVELMLGKRFDAKAAAELRPDLVVLATGAVARELQSGLAGRVLRGVDVLDRGLAREGDVVVVGGGLVGLDVAEFLASRGAKVTVLELQRHVGQGLEWNLRKMKVRSLKEKGVTLRTESRVVRIEKESVAFVDAEGNDCSVRADAVVAAVGSSAYNPLDGPIRGLGFEVTTAGDCRESRGLAEAISEGFEAALGLGSR
jgi:2,4-dienoyl-CoA reductase-like NADH-dependent reductase (Old Yellow Enzyme family)/thioredoxin reductase